MYKNQFLYNLCEKIDFFILIRVVNPLLTIMKTFLNKIDHDFYNKYMKVSFPAGKCILTNKGLYSEEPDENIRENITHMITNSYSKKLEKYKFNDYPNLRFLSYNTELDNINLKKLNNLKVLILPSAEIQSKKLLNLPNIEILIFKDIISSFFGTTMDEYIFMLKNLPIMLNTIVFDGVDNIDDEDLESYDNYEINHYLKEKMALQKLPHDCKTYFIDYDTKIYTITN